MYLVAPFWPDWLIYRKPKAACLNPGTPSLNCTKIKYVLLSLDTVGPKEANQNWLLTNADLDPFIPPGS